jgi:divinyl protochlorophyllide a 8-vinyl-reductase
MRAPTDDRVGPNAITRTYEALLAAGDRRIADEIFAHAGIARYVPCPPTRPVPVAEFRALVRETHRFLGRESALAVLADAGRRVGTYVLTHRIPGPVRWLLPRLPAPLALRLLFRAMARNAWTFAGHAPVHFDAPRGQINVIGAPTADALGPDPACGFYTAAFSVLIAALIRPSPQVTEDVCCATGAPACRFVLRSA